MKDTELKLICELIKNSRKSDRELAKSIGVSQPTISRVRSRLEKEVIMEYTMRPNLHKLGFQILAVTFAKLNPENQQNPKILERAKDFVESHPNIMFASTGRGVHSDRLAVSIHKSYSDYSEFMQELKRDYGEFYTVTESFLVSLESDKILRPMTLRALADCLKEEKSE